MNLIHRFKKDIGGVVIPRRFNNPFYYSPHHLCLMAAEEVREMISRDKSIMEEVAREIGRASCRERVCRMV